PRDELGPFCYVQRHGGTSGPRSALKMADRQRTLIFIPTYDEHENVGLICESILALGLDADLVFLDDNSPDGTGDAIDQLAARHPRVKALHRSGKLGIGSAHLDGIAYAFDQGYT